MLNRLPFCISVNRSRTRLLNQKEKLIKLRISEDLCDINCCLSELILD